MPEDGSFPALERLKAETDGLHVLVESASPTVGAALEWLLDLEYGDEKAALLERRETVRKAYTTHRKRVEQTYGSAVVRALERREDGEQPRFDVERLEQELDDAAAELDELREDDDIDEQFLTRRERRRLAELEKEVSQAREYVRNVAAFRRRRADIESRIERFDDRFEPYVGGQRYMVSSDHEALVDLSDAIWRALADAARELRLPVLPDADAGWLADRKTRFGELRDQLPRYNERYVAREREVHEDLFTTDDGPLNDSQQDAIVRDDRRNLVDASAGTGKTLTLTHRFQYLLAKGVPPSDIVAITYTGDAAAEMRRRIADATAVDPDDLQISTIHSFANRIYREAHGRHESDLGSAREALVADYLDAARAGRSADDADVSFPDWYRRFREGYEKFWTVEDGYVEEHKRWNETAEAFVARKFETFVEKARTFDLSPADIAARLDGTHRVRDAFGRAGAALVGAYDRVVEREAAPTDFDDMVRTATEVVRSNPERFGDRFRHLLVDEFQDVSDDTLAFVESFMEGGSETYAFCVGDDWQSIFGFNGSNVRHFTGYPDAFDDVTETQLAINYRCPPAIVEAGTALMRQSEAPQNEKAVRADSDHETTPTLHTLDELYDARVVPYVADMVETELETRAPDEVMVLSRNDGGSRYMRDLHTELERRDIPHRRPKGVDDYLPDDYRASLPHDVAFDDRGFVEWDVPERVEPPEDGPPVVQTQSIHASKGTEAPVVVLMHAVDDDPDGLPIERRADVLVEPALDITADHVPEERRLCYVALTRAEAEFHAVARTGGVSRYLQDIEDHFEERSVPFPAEFVGRCTRYSPPKADGQPVKARLDCGRFEVPLLAWPDENPPRLEEGAIYRVGVENPDWQIYRSDDGDHPDEIRFDRTPVDRLDGNGATAESD